MLTDAEIEQFCPQSNFGGTGQQNKVSFDVSWKFILIYSTVISVRNSVR